MKKLFTVLLILSLLLPAAAMAASDPIIGYWYIFVDLREYPEMSPSFGDYDHLITLYYFDESGTIVLLENDVKDNRATPTFAGGGKWEKSVSGYKVSVLGIGETTATVDGETMMMKIQNSVLSMKLRKVITFNPYADYSN